MEREAANRSDGVKPECLDEHLRSDGQHPPALTRPRARGRRRRAAAESERLASATGRTMICRMSDLTVILPPALQSWVDARLAEGRYADAADYLRDLVRRDQDQAEEDTAWVRAAIAEGLASGVVDQEPDEVIEEIIARYPADGG